MSGFALSTKQSRFHETSSLLCHHDLIVGLLLAFLSLSTSLTTSLTIRTPSQYLESFHHNLPLSSHHGILADSGTNASIISSDGLSHGAEFSIYSTRDSRSHSWLRRSPLISTIHNQQTDRTNTRLFDSYAPAIRIVYLGHARP